MKEFKRGEEKTIEEVQREGGLFHIEDRQVFYERAGYHRENRFTFKA